MRTGGALYRTRTVAGDLWEPWQALGGPVAGAGVVGNPSLVPTRGGRLAVLARGSDGFAHVNGQLTEYGAWSGWSKLGAHAISSDVAAVAVGTTLEVFARDAVTQRVWVARGDVDVFSETVLDGPATLTFAPAAALDRQGGLRLVVADASADLHWNRRRPDEAWAGWNARPAATAAGVYATAAPGRELVRTTELASWAAAP